MRDVEASNSGSERDVEASNFQGPGKGKGCESSASVDKHSTIVLTSGVTLASSEHYIISRE